MTILKILNAAVGPVEGNKPGYVPPMWIAIPSVIIAGIGSCIPYGLIIYAVWHGNWAMATFFAVLVLWQEQRS